MPNQTIDRMRVSDLRVLSALLDDPNLTRAAQRLDLDQPVVSKALARLRRSFGDPIFVRHGAGMAPTSRAAALTASVSDVLAAAERLGAECRVVSLSSRATSTSRELRCRLSPRATA